MSNDDGVANVQIDCAQLSGRRQPRAREKSKEGGQDGGSHALDISN